MHQSERVVRLHRQQSEPRQVAIECEEMVVMRVVEEGISMYYK